MLNRKYPPLGHGITRDDALVSNGWITSLPHCVRVPTVCEIFPKLGALEYIIAISTEAIIHLPGEGTVRIQL